MDVSDRIKLFRKEHLKISQEKLGELLGVKRDVINNIENNRLKKPEQKEPLYRLICEKFNVDEHWLRSGEGEMFNTRTRSEAIIDFSADLLKEEDESFRRRFVEALAVLDVEEWKVIEKIAKAMVDKNGEE